MRVQTTAFPPGVDPLEHRLGLQWDLSSQVPFSAPQGDTREVRAHIPRYKTPAPRGHTHPSLRNPGTVGTGAAAQAGSSIFTSLLQTFTVAPVAPFGSASPWRTRVFTERQARWGKSLLSCLFPLKDEDSDRPLRASSLDFCLRPVP